MLAPAAPANALRAVIYCRVSTSGQAEGDEIANAAGLTVVSETSLDTQEAAGRVFADEQGWRVDAVFTDVYSGHSLFERPGLTDLREYVAANAIDRVIVYSLDRLSRKMGVVAFLNDELTEVDAELVFVTERYTNDSTGKLLQAFHEWKAESEREAIVERTMRGKRAKARAGRFQPGNRPRYGYRWPHSGRSRYEIDPEKAPTVQQIFAWAAAGDSTRTIAMRLTRGAVPTPTGRGVTWVHTVVRNILTDEMYTGRAFAFRRAGKTVRSRNGTRYRRLTERPEDQRIALPEGTVPALVDNTTFALVGDRLAKNQAEARRNNSNPEASLLRGGFLVCGYCGNNLTVMNRVGRYRCSTNSATVDRCTGQPTIAVGIADGEAWKRARRTLLDRSIIEREVERRATDDGAAERDLARIDKLLAEVDRKRKNLTANLADLDPDSAGEVRTMLRGLSDRRQALVTERDEAQIRHERRQEDLGRLRTIQQWQDRVAQNLDDLDYAGRRDALLAVGLRMTVWKTDHTPRWEIVLEIDPETITDSSS
jgi:site-specific DNA recombinase